jgi:hypothetical protein
MTNYNFNVKAFPYEGKTHCIEIDTVALYGYFEMSDGSEGGGLWFELDGTVLVLSDYDGVSFLPRRIIAALRGLGVRVTSDFE